MHIEQLDTFGTISLDHCSERGHVEHLNTVSNMTTLNYNDVSETV